VGVQGVTIQLYKESNATTGLQTGTGGDTLVATTTTGSNGAYNFSGLGAGTYYIKEVVPTGWVSTTPNPVTVKDAIFDQIGRFGFTDALDFGNAHITTGSHDGTIGFWTNKNGQTMLTGSSSSTQLKSQYFSAITNLANSNQPGSTVLVDANGNYVPQSYFTSPNGYTFLQTYLNNANATNMAYMLSAQLLATELNIKAGFVNANQTIYTPNVSMSAADRASLAAPPHGITPIGTFVTIQTVINDAILELKYAPYTRVAGPDRTFEEALMSIFTGINQAGNIFVI
jgi:hypothetical protein